MAEISNAELLNRYEQRLGSKGATRTHYLRYASDFLNFAKGNLNRETILKYLDHLKRKYRYSEGSINFVFRVIRTLYKRNEVLLSQQGIEWPFAHGESPQISEDQIQAPALHPNTIIRMIQAVREKGKPDEMAFLALSTTYGLRRVEMVELENKDIRLKDRTIHIATAKHGRERTHLIPEEIIPYLKQYDFDQPISEFFLFTLWYRFEYRIKLKHIPRVGFHSIRRTVNTLLARKLSDITVKSFMRHKQRTSSDMTFRYSAVKFVGEEEESMEVVGGALQADNDVFAEGVHPFVRYWR